MMRWLQEKMRGRYGSDELNRVLIGIALVLTFANLFIRNGIVSLLAFLLLILCYVRMFSRNYMKRQSENYKFLKYWNPIRFKFNKFIAKQKGRKDYKYFKCPKCAKAVRVPRGKGKICITCPECREEFNRKS